MRLARLIGWLYQGPTPPAKVTQALTTRDHLRVVSEALLREEHTHIVLVSDEIASQLRVWSEPVQIMVDLAPGGLLEMTCRSIDLEAELAKRNGEL